MKNERADWRNLWLNADDHDGKGWDWACWFGLSPDDPTPAEGIRVHGHGKTPEAAVRDLAARLMLDP